jgi:soluble lytic murein transglycosylase
VYWKARATLARAAPGDEGEPARAAAREALDSISKQLNFYGKLATEELGQRVSLPAAPLPLSADERDAPRQVPGFQRALQLINLGLRSEGVREWNFTLRGLGERELLAAAQLACEREVWDRCINTSDRTKAEVDMTQRFPTPHRELMQAKSKQAGLDAAVVYGLIRQESRFIGDARSHVGASGLMQLMPATARWTAKQMGLPFTQQMINERELNLQLGTYYLKRVLDDFDGSLAMATAAYNAGPGRPRRWREGATMEPAAWAETIPFNETRDYVKKVLSNSVYYAAMLGQPVPTLKARLGPLIGPREATAPQPNKDLP